MLVQAPGLAKAVTWESLGRLGLGRFGGQFLGFWENLGNLWQFLDVFGETWGLITFKSIVFPLDVAQFCTFRYT